MPAVALADERAEQVGRLIRDAYADVLGERLEALLVHGSAVTGGYIEGYSDFDFVVFMHGSLSTGDAQALQAHLGSVDHRPFEYLQVSRVVDLDQPPTGDDRLLLIDNAYATLVGDYPEGLAVPRRGGAQGERAAGVGLVTLAAGPEAPPLGRGHRRTTDAGGSLPHDRSQARVAHAPR